MNGNGQNEKKPTAYGNMRIPSIEERKVPYRAPESDNKDARQPQRPTAQRTPTFTMKQAPKTESPKPTVPPADEIIDIPSPPMDYYPLAGRKKHTSYGPSASDLEVYSMLALIGAMIFFIVFILFAYGGYIFSDATGVIFHPEMEKDAVIAKGTAISPLSESDYFTDDSDTPVTPADPDEPYKFGEPVSVSTPADDSYFTDAVFIGDSRTEGLYLYSKLKSTFICERGLNVSKFFSDGLDKYGGKTAYDTLKETDCNKIYVSFGINEIGWVTSAFINSYGELIDKIKEAKPDAVIYVQNIYPMSKAQHDKNIYGNNDKLHEYNEKIAEICREKEVYLLDVASYFSDGEGHLKDSYETGVDGAHFKGGGQGYVDWTNYIRTHTVQP